MDLQFFAPQTTGEWLAAIAAAATAMVGMALLLVPRATMHLMGLAPHSAIGVSEIRGAFGGSWVGFGLAALLLAQPLIYLALGLAYTFAVVGRLISFLVDRSFSMQTTVATLAEALAAFFLIAYPLQWIP